ncbi:MAG TPA: LON peptidase substrate-binding domain-containing protein [Gammaproteobacteria bacterium]
MTEIALFPLKTVLFPGGPLPLRIFEPRYLAMVSRCLTEQEGFGVLLIKDGSEVGEAETHDVGTIANIVDWHQESDGLLGIKGLGADRFRVHSVERQPDGLYTGRVELLEPEEPAEMTEEFRSLQRLLKNILAQLDEHYGGISKTYDDATWVGYRLAELLPLPMATRQIMLEMSDPIRRLGMLLPHADDVAVRASS